jgi:hypothetical protein
MQREERGCVRTRNHKTWPNSRRLQLNSVSPLCIKIMRLAHSIDIVLGNNALSTSSDQTFLWARLLCNPDLHAVSLFVVSTHVNLLGLDGRSGPDQPTALLFRGQALRCIQKVSRSPGLAYVGNGTSTFKMCLSILAAWEKVRKGRWMRFESRMRYSLVAGLWRRSRVHSSSNSPGLDR